MRLLIDARSVFGAHIFLRRLDSSMANVVHWLTARVSSTRLVSANVAVGLALVYVGGYFLPLLTATEAYFLTSLDPFKIIVLPTIEAVCVMSALLWAISAAILKWCSPRVTTGFFVLLLSIFAALALKGVSQAAGFQWQDSIPRGHDFLATQRYFKIVVLLISLVLVWSRRGALYKLARVFSSLGFAFGVLAAVRLIVASSGHSAHSEPSASTLLSPMQLIQARDGISDRAKLVSNGLPRRVVWILFDETDFNQVYLDPSTKLHLANFEYLSQVSVFATNANSPASATLYSIPALLTGVPINGKGIRINSEGILSLENSDRQLIPFNAENSIFGVLRARGQSASILGFLHPYCHLFELKRCDSFVWPEVGTFGAAILANAPDSFSNRFRYVDNWANITRDSLKLLPAYLGAHDALTFIHMNFPHLPASYADASNNVLPSSNPLTEYSRNLLFTDKVLGQVIQSMKEYASTQDLLLVISTDHWLRNRWYQADRAEVVRPVPLMIWRVGETRGTVLTQPVSTVHTSEMILDFLHGDVNNQSQIADWWAHESTSQSFIAPNT